MTDIVIDEESKGLLADRIKGLLESGSIQFGGDLQGGEMILTILAKDLKKTVNDTITDPKARSYIFGDNCVWCDLPVAMTLFTHDKLVNAIKNQVHISIICPECALKVLTPKNITYTNLIQE